jgi:hypothetical protein
MNATFQYAVRYWVEVTCVTPLRTGDTEGNGRAILRHWDGTPFLQGSSLAGALSDWKKNPVLFGSLAQEGSLIVSDLNFQRDAQTTQRPRLRMDGVTGTGDDGGKFDVTALTPGQIGHFELVWCGNAQAEEIYPVVEEYLSALADGEILLGAQKSNGFGRVSLQVWRQSYDMKNPKDLDAWLGDKDCRQAVTLHPKIQKQVQFHVTAEFPNLLIKAAGADGVGEQGIDSPPMRENGKLLIPGSSLKGTIRGRMEKIAAFCIPGGAAEAQSLIEHLLGRQSEGDDNGVAGLVRVEDAAVAELVGGENPPKVTRIRINRLTGGVMRGALFSEQPVAARWTWNISLPESEAAGCGLLLYALRDLGLGLYSLGSGTSIGRGRVNWLRVDVMCPGGKTAQMECSPEGVAVHDPENLFAQWQAAWKGETL